MYVRCLNQRGRLGSVVVPATPARVVPAAVDEVDHVTAVFGARIGFHLNGAASTSTSSSTGPGVAVSTCAVQPAPSEAIDVAATMMMSALLRRNQIEVCSSFLVCMMTCIQQRLCRTRA